MSRDWWRSKLDELDRRGVSYEVSVLLSSGRALRGATVPDPEGLVLQSASGKHLLIDWGAVQTLQIHEI